MDKINIVRSPFRISLFGGSTDYKSFYENYGSFIIGTPIDKYCHLSMRYRPEIFDKKFLCMYSKYELVDSINELENPLIRETLRYFNIDKPIELTSFSDIPSKTGLGGSSAYCVALAYLVQLINNNSIVKNDLIKSCIKIEREILNESGGIQDQIWPFVKGLSTIEINKNGDFFIKPMPITEEFELHLNDSMTLIYTNEKRITDVASSYEGNVDNKKNILEIAKQAYNSFIKEDIYDIGKLLYNSWLDKKEISKEITNKAIDNIIEDVISMGAYGAKLLGSGSSGFVLVISDSKVKNKIYDKYNKSIIDFKISKTGIKKIY